ncbi:hypothetical protein ACFTAO_03570 [Paenibacillus rhizoplanae]
MQAAEYALNAPLLVTEEGLSIPVTHGPAPLFDLVYLLSDKNERGLMSVHGMDDNYEIIAHISLLKNRVRPAADQASGHGGYNNMTFKKRHPRQHRQTRLRVCRLLGGAAAEPPDCAGGAVPCTALSVRAAAYRPYPES